MGNCLWAGLRGVPVEGVKWVETWKTVARRRVLDAGAFLSVEMHDVRLPDGASIEDWAWVITPDYVNVVIETAQRQFLCFRQTKYAVEGDSLAIVGGYIDRGEDPLVAAQREMLEETGYVAPEWHALGAYAVDGNRGCGVAHLFLARGAIWQQPIAADDLEEQKIELLPRQTLESALENGDFKVLPWAAAVALALQKLTRSGQALTVALIGFFLMAGCVASPANEEALSASATSTPAPTQESDDETTSPTFEITQLALAGDGETFLARISAEKRALGPDVQHTYVEWLDPAGTLWQGEALTDSARRVLLLQPAQSGGTVGFLVSATFDVSLSEIIASLPWDGEPTDSPHPQIRFVRATQGGDGLWKFDVTLEYPDSGWEDYADGWHVAIADGTVLATRILLHPHENEQPFTRSQSGVSVPRGVESVLVRSHDLVSGYGPEPLEVPLGADAQTERYQVTRQ